MAGRDSEGQSITLLLSSAPARIGQKARLGLELKVHKIGFDPILKFVLFRT
jgi:hypothetical protein